MISLIPTWRTIWSGSFLSWGMIDDAYLVFFFEYGYHIWRISCIPFWVWASYMTHILYSFLSMGIIYDAYLIFFFEYGYHIWRISCIFAPGKECTLTSRFLDILRWPVLFIIESPMMRCVPFCCHFSAMFSRSFIWLFQPSRGFLWKRCYENLQQIYRRTPMVNCDFIKVAKQLYLA